MFRNSNLGALHTLLVPLLTGDIRRRFELPLDTYV